MEKRQSKRIIPDLDVVLVSRSLNYKGVIKNIADDGICINMHSDQNVSQLLKGLRFIVKFTLPSGEEIDLQCEVIRTHRQISDELESIVAMKIIDQPPEYREFLAFHR